MRKLTIQSLVLGASLSLLAPMQGCQNSSSKQGKAQLPNVAIDSGDITINDDQAIIELDSGDFLNVTVVDGISYIPVAVALDQGDFAQLRTRLKNYSADQRQSYLRSELSSVVKVLDDELGVLSSRQYPKLGYFVAYVAVDKYNKMGEIDFPYNIVANPVASNRIEAHTYAESTSVDPRDLSNGYSPLEEMGIQKFEELIANELGVTPSGERVKIGIIDSGITINHKTFNNQAGDSRISYIDDFTGEGYIYFHPQAKFTVTIGSEDNTLVVEAEALQKTVGTSLPDPAKRDSINITLKVKRNSDLWNVLTTPNSGAKLGFLTESSYARTRTGVPVVDINNDGLTDSNFATIFVPGTDSVAGGTLYFSQAANDFTKSSPLRDWNQSRETVQIAAETLGFTFGTTEVGTTSLIYAKPVGIDGNGHGTHVAGIAAGQKLFSNDSDEQPLVRGVAPSADILFGRVCLAARGCVDATEAMAQLALRGAKVVNLSLGYLSENNDGFDVGSLMADRLTEVMGTLYVRSAGNEGPGVNTIGNSATSRRVLAVGATSSNKMANSLYRVEGAIDPKFEDPSNPLWDSFVTDFSSRGPTAAGGFKPDVVGPGILLSAQPLNHQPGSFAGADVLQGTSMSSPAVAGAIAMLLDAALLYNEKNPDRPLPHDPITLKKVLMASALPFNVTSFHPGGVEASTSGKYTWVDQGRGMVDLPSAWAALKLERDQQPMAAVSLDGKPVNLDYEVRILRENPNGQDFSGEVDDGDTKGKRYGRGIWFKYDEPLRRVDVQVTRRLPQTLSDHDKYGELLAELRQSADRFKLTTEIHGSHVNWLRVGTNGTITCLDSEVSDQLLLVGEGAIELPNGDSIAPTHSELYVCIDSSKLATLSPGDHGAIISAYRVDRNDQVEANPSFEIPVYLTVPHKTLSGSTAYAINDDVRGLDVDKHYIEIPEGTSSVTITLEVPEITTDSVTADQCAIVLATVYEGTPVATTPRADWDRSAPFALNCSLDGTLRKINQANGKTSFTRLNPKPGIWNVIIAGYQSIVNSKYKLTVDFAQGKLDSDVIELTSTALSKDLSLRLSGSDPMIDTDKSSFYLKNFTKRLEQAAEAKEVTVPLLGEEFVTFDASIQMLEISTALSDDADPKTDLDILLLECISQDSATCRAVASSAGADSNEQFVADVEVGKYYQLKVDGYTVPKVGDLYTIDMKLYGKPEPQALNVGDFVDSTYNLGITVDPSSPYLASPYFLDLGLDVEGQIDLVNSKGQMLMSIYPVKVLATPSSN
ncbi:S8 family serine peptidase [Pseudobacteriovorax antillogorgiicola]|uniref:Subtilase family protein n=1 Tax=Pseudobacteriovorax antillogorgiicola TaxID=1513793 RepID=A0A1Y6BL34_9BACT|nr:S8 family serine peptidase [Pseudobacteriovorax antillogorgiicola]TCS54629.1 subtilase family protein [Pseudobacteriovorax antillogorgiicola]SMF17193.1 Subtilase family protein [Pseudobacteriovorax antillogorgiicola]